jgi:hypothetical protein
MKHTSTRELYDYWNARRAGRPAPERGDIEPGAIRRVLADTFVLAFDPGTGHPFRIAGTRVCAAFGRELRGEGFIGLWAPNSQALIRELLTVVAAEAVGVVASASAAAEDGSPLDLEWLALPLRHRGRTDARVLGALTPTEVPYWLGTSSLGQLTLGTFRYLGPDLRANTTPDIADITQATQASPTARLRRGLLVYDGGQP